MNATDLLVESWSPGEVTYRINGLPLVGELLAIMHSRRTDIYLQRKERVLLTDSPGPNPRLGSSNWFWERLLTLKQSSLAGGAAIFFGTTLAMVVTTVSGL